MTKQGKSSANLVANLASTRTPSKSCIRGPIRWVFCANLFLRRNQRLMHQMLKGSGLGPQQMDDVLKTPIFRN